MNGGLIPSFLSKLFGASWQTSIWGYITIVAVTVAASPKLINFLPDSIEGFVSGVFGIIAAVTAVKFVQNTKDKNVTGGDVQQTAEGNVASPNSKSSSVTETIKASIKAGETVTPEQTMAVTKP